MLRFLSLFTFIVACFIVGAYAGADDQPGCYSCPPQDSAGYPVGKTDQNSDPMFCSYPSVEGEDPNDFYCTYSKTDGSLVEDHNANACPKNAVNNCGGIKRRAAHLANYARDTKPDYVKDRRNVA